MKQAKPVGVSGRLVSEVHCDVSDPFLEVTERRAPAKRSTGSTRERFESCVIRCQSGQAAGTGKRCLGCPQLVNMKPLPGTSDFMVRCAFSAKDPSRQIMTLPPALARVPPSSTVAAARQRASGVGAEYVLVVERGELVGVLSRADLDAAPAAGLVAARMGRIVVVIGPETWLSTCRQLLADTGVDCLLVVDAGALVGLVTRADLGRVGVTVPGLGVLP